MSKALDDLMVVYRQKEYYACLTKVYAQSPKYINPQSDDLCIQACAKTLHEAINTNHNVPEDMIKDIQSNL
jgi:hypothetical protein